MTCIISSRGFRRADVAPDQVTEAIMGATADGQTYFCVEKSPDENLGVIFSDKGCAVVYINYDPTYIALDASNDPTEAKGRVTLLVDNEPTPFPANMKLTKQQARQIVKEFCASGELSKTVYWVREGPSPDSRGERQASDP